MYSPQRSKKNTPMFWSPVSLPPRQPPVSPSWGNQLFAFCDIIFPALFIILSSVWHHLWIIWVCFAWYWTQITGHYTSHPGNLLSSYFADTFQYFSWFPFCFREINYLMSFVSCYLHLLFQPLSRVVGGSPAFPPTLMAACWWLSLV